ncbi:Collagen alpha-1(XV) chain [Apis cerana cerana]|uniref:Collagen alpha-1(XV) chain n=1 Tax=Apis cerana cerana TaxID=94128 RepID=A0A2A3EB50_APICC|nr:Collagen alpha-1(XV) chain [Apis cerana cerana]
MFQGQNKVSEFYENLDALLKFLMDWEEIFKENFDRLKDHQKFLIQIDDVLAIIAMQISFSQNEIIGFLQNFIPKITHSTFLQNSTFYILIIQHSTFNIYAIAAVASVDTDDNNLYIDDGLDGFPSFGFRPGSEVKQPYRLYLPEKLPAEFTLVATFKPMSFRTSYLFAVLNPFETVVQLGIRISDGPGTNQNVSLVYTNSDLHSHSEEVAKFTVPKLSRKWSKIVIRVSTTDVTLYLNCHEMARQRVTRIPLELVFDTASTLYIAQAGPHIQEKYDKILYELSIGNI